MIRIGSGSACLDFGRPSTAECLVELHDRHEASLPGLGELDLGGKELPLRVQHLQIVRDASLVPHVCQLDGVTAGRYQTFLLLLPFTGFLVGDKRIIDFAEGLLNGLFVLDQGGLLAGFRDTQVRAKRAALKERKNDGGAVTPELRRTGKEIGEVAAGKPVCAGESNLRKEGRLRQKQALDVMPSCVRPTYSGG